MKKNCLSMMPTNLFVAHHHRSLLLFLSQQQRRRRPSRRRGSSSSSSPPSCPCRRLSFAEMTTRERETSQRESLVQFVFRVLETRWEKKERLKTDMRDQKAGAFGAHARRTKNGRRVRAFDRRGEHLCVVTFLIPLLLLLFYGDDERAFSNFFGCSDPSFVLLFVSLPQ